MHVIYYTKERVGEWKNVVDLPFRRLRAEREWRDMGGEKRKQIIKQEEKRLVMLQLDETFVTVLLVIVTVMKNEVKAL